MPLIATITTLRAKAFNREILARTADWLAVGVAVSLPWSTTASGILIALWVLAVFPTLTLDDLRRELFTAAGGLPQALWLLAAFGMLWADVSWSERLHGLSSFTRLLCIPLLLAQFRRSDYGLIVCGGFFASVTILLALSLVLALLPSSIVAQISALHPVKWYGVPVKNYIFQSESFLICAFVLFGRAFDEVGSRHWRSAACVIAIAVLGLVDIFFVATGRTTLLVAPVLLLLLGWRQYRWKGLLGACVLGGIVSATVYFESRYLREQLNTSIDELQAYRRGDPAVDRTSLHLEYLRKSWSFVAGAPIIGHGTGSIAEQFRNAASGQTGIAGEATVNPHSQIFAVAIQLGLVGGALLAAMWIGHLMLFRGGTFMDWIGIVVVVENIVSSLVNSHLFDFTQGWLYVFGVGVVGGTVLQQRHCASAGRSEE
jgi:O-antigen ligase